MGGPPGGGACAVGVEELSPQPEKNVPAEMTHKQSTVQRMATTFPTKISSLCGQSRLLHVSQWLSRKVAEAVTQALR
jgi:hypothetical protein